ncbi:MAG: DUF4159 domain-containing protein [Planctomycetota bacterium]|jgi:hypothetical protein
MSSGRLRYLDCSALAAATALWLPITAVAAGPSPVAAETLTDEQVQAATRAIVEELYRAKDPQRFWDPPSWDPDRHGQRAQAGGYTALAVLALLHAGESYQDPRLRDAVAHLEQAPLAGTYAVAVRAHVWARLPDKFSDRLRADSKWLADAFQQRPRGWGYEMKPRSSWYDNSLAQYGALGLWEAAKRGVPVHDRYWQLLEERFVANQLPDGGWSYRNNQPVTGSMTAAGLTALFITQDYLHAREALALPASGTAPAESAIARGLAWMDRHFSVLENPGRDAYFFYYLYGVERVALASGYRAFGGRDWFRHGAAQVIDRLCAADPDTGRLVVRRRLRGGDPTKVRQLAFGLMFLSRGRVPVAVSKLSARDVAWNNRPRDVANLTQWIAQETEAALSWQIVSLDSRPHEWLQSPLLYLASHEALHWVDDTEALADVKRYLDLGGLLLAVNEGKTRAFGQSVRQAGRAMYPQHAWRTLPPDHWAYALHFPVRSRRPPLLSLSNGVRELIILAPDRDLSAPLQVRDEDHGAFPTASNIYLYASEMNRPRPRLARHVTGRPAPAREPGAASTTVVRASYEGNWNPEPLALEMFAAAVAAQRGLGVGLADGPLAAITKLDPPPDLVVVSGTDAHEFTGPQRRAIRAYVEAGGVILFETAGGRGSFARAAEETCRELLGDLAGPPQPLLHSRIVTGEDLPGAPALGRVDYRPFAVDVFGARETRPRLQGMAIDGSPRVLFSREDLSHALLDQPCWGIAGYAPASARDLMGNIVAHGAALRAAATMQP